MGFLSAHVVDMGFLSAHVVGMGFLSAHMVDMGYLARTWSYVILFYRARGRYGIS